MKKCKKVLAVMLAFCLCAGAVVLPKNVAKAAPDDVTIVFDVTDERYHLVPGTTVTIYKGVDPATAMTETNKLWTATDATGDSLSCTISKSLLTADGGMILKLQTPTGYVLDDEVWDKTEQVTVYHAGEELDTFLETTVHYVDVVEATSVGAVITSGTTELTLNAGQEYDYAVLDDIFNSATYTDNTSVTRTLAEAGGSYYFEYEGENSPIMVAFYYNVNGEQKVFRESDYENWTVFYNAIDAFEATLPADFSWANNFDYKFYVTAPVDVQLVLYKGAASLSIPVHFVAAAPQASTETVKAPKTADNVPVATMGICLSLSVAGLGVLCGKRRKEY